MHRVVPRRRERAVARDRRERRRGREGMDAMCACMCVPSPLSPQQTRADVVPVARGGHTRAHTRTHTRTHSACCSHYVGRGWPAARCIASWQRIARDCGKRPQSECVCRRPGLTRPLRPAFPPQRARSSASASARAAPLSGALEGERARCKARSAAQCRREQAQRVTIFLLSLNS